MYIYVQYDVIYVSYDCVTLFLLGMAVPPQHGEENAVST